MKLLDVYAKEREERRIRKKLKMKVQNELHKLEIILRSSPVNAFEKVYIMLAIERIVNELAIYYSIGRVELGKEGKVITMKITNPSLTQTDIKNILELDKKKKNVYTLLEALKEMDSYSVITNPEGKGIQVILKKEI